MEPVFADRIRQRYPEGLTGILVVGGTRTTYVLERNRSKPDPGTIEDFSEYAAYVTSLYLGVISAYYELGGQNLIIPAFSYQGFTDRGTDYTAQALQAFQLMMGTGFTALYRKYEVDPYFVGIDTLLKLPEGDERRQFGEQFVTWRENWDYRPERRKLIWEIAPIPTFSFWRAQEVMDAAQQAELAAVLDETDDLQVIHDQLYRYYAQAVYGTDIPMPHFYLGSNRNGEMKLHAMLPIALLCGGDFRVFYTPYPTLFMTRETWQVMLEDLAFGKAKRSKKLDYSGQWTPEQAEAEYQRIQALRADPQSTLGLIRPVDFED